MPCTSPHRLGSAGTVREDVAVGSIAVASLGAAEIVQNCAAFHQPPGAVPAEPYYRTSGVVLPDDQLSQMVRCHDAGVGERAPARPAHTNVSVRSRALRDHQLLANLKQHTPAEQVLEGINLTADSFYSSQGRVDSSFEDHNETLLQDVVQTYPKAVSLEMETFQLFHLAQLARPRGCIRATAAGACRGPAPATPAACGRRGSQCAHAKGCGRRPLLQPSSSPTAAPTSSSTRCWRGSASRRPAAPCWRPSPPARSDGHRLAA